MFASLGSAAVSVAGPPIEVTLKPRDASLIGALIRAICTHEIQPPRNKVYNIEFEAGNRYHLGMNVLGVCDGFGNGRSFAVLRGALFRDHFLLLKLDANHNIMRATLYIIVGWENTRNMFELVAAMVRADLVHSLD